VVELRYRICRHAAIVGGMREIQTRFDARQSKVRTSSRRREKKLRQRSYQAGQQRCAGPFCP
jgi:hypothetical protein